MEKLRECPFCGGIPAQDIIKDSYYRNRYTIECGTCGLQMWDIAKDSLYRSWNTRHEQKYETCGFKNSDEEVKEYQELRELQTRNFTTLLKQNEQLEKKLKEAQRHFNELNSLHPHDIRGNLEKWEEIFTFLKSLKQEKQNEG